MPLPNTDRPTRDGDFSSPRLDPIVVHYPQVWLGLAVLLGGSGSSLDEPKRPAMLKYCKKQLKKKGKRSRKTCSFRIFVRLLNDTWNSAQKQEATS